MSNQTGKNDSRTLQGGEIVYLLKKPGHKWAICSYECMQRVRYDLGVGGLMFESKQGLPQEWNNREFDSIDDAVVFVQSQIDSGKVPANKLLT